MQTLKGLVSVKSTERKRLPPLHNSASLATASSPLPSISAKIDSEPLPFIPYTDDTDKQDDKQGEKQDEKQGEEVNSLAQQEYGANSNYLNQVDRDASATHSVHTAPSSSSKELKRSEDTLEGTLIYTPTVTAEAALFQTTSTSTPPAPRVNTLEDHRLAVLNLNNQNDQRRLEQRGLRTWPMLAVFSTFCCNPVLGLIAALLTLKAENSYYQSNVIMAQREARIAKFFLVMAIITGSIILLSIVIWVGVRCASLTGCPGIRQ